MFIDSFVHILVLFSPRYMREFGFTIPDRKIVVDDIRIRAVGKSNLQITEDLQEAMLPPKSTGVSRGKGLH